MASKPSTPVLTSDEAFGKSEAGSITAGTATGTEPGQPEGGNDGSVAKVAEDRGPGAVPPPEFKEGGYGWWVASRSNCLCVAGCGRVRLTPRAMRAMRIGWWY
jgi:hypothetical protein